MSRVRQDVSALRELSVEQGGRQEESGTVRHAEVVSALVTHGEQLDHLTEGMRVIAEVVSAMADQFPDADADSE